MKFIERIFQRTHLPKKDIEMCEKAEDVDTQVLVEDLGSYSITGQYLVRHDLPKDRRGDGYFVVKQRNLTIVVLIDVSFAGEKYLKVGKGVYDLQPTAEPEVKKDLEVAITNEFTQPSIQGIKGERIIKAVNPILNDHIDSAFNVFGIKDIGASITTVVIDPSKDHLQLVTVGTNFVALEANNGFQILHQQDQFYSPNPLGTKGGRIKPIEFQLPENKSFMISTDGILLSSTQPFLKKGEKEGLSLTLKPKS